MEILHHQILSLLSYQKYISEAKKTNTTTDYEEWS